jgi:hypothetical protein
MYQMAEGKKVQKFERGLTAQTDQKLLEEAVSQDWRQSVVGPPDSNIYLAPTPELRVNVWTWAIQKST